MSTAISKSNERAEQSLKKKPSKTVTTADTIDYLIYTFTGKNWPDKSAEERQLSSKQKVKKHSLKINVKRGIRALGVIADEIRKLPNVQNIKKQQEANLRSLKSANRHIKRDIAITAICNKEGMTAGSLITKKSFRLYTNIGPAVNKRHRQCQQKNIPQIFTQSRD